MNGSKSTVVQPLVPARRSRLSRFDALLDTRHDRTEVLAYTRALMAGSKVMLIDEDNRGQGWVSPEEAVRSRRPFAIQVRPDWLAIDSDQPELLPKLLDLEAAMHRDGLHPFVLRSGRKDHAHLWVQISEPALLAEYKRRVEGLHVEGLRFDIREGSNLCRAPLSPHRHGRPLSVLGGQPDTPYWQETLKKIGREQQRQEIEATWRRITGDPTWCLPGRTYVAAAAHTKPSVKRRRPLDRKWERLVREGVQPGRRHDEIQSVTLAAVNAGWTEDEAFLVVREGKLGEKILEQGDEAAQREWFHLGWVKAVERAAERPPIPGGPHLQAKVARLRAEAEGYPWKPRSGTTDRLVLEARLDIVARTGKLEHDASVRDVAEATGLDWSTVSRADGRLWKSGWLVPVASAERQGFAMSARWTIQVPSLPSQFAISATHATKASGGDEACVALIAKSHDAFRRHGLGKDTLQVWAHLDATVGVKVSALATALNRHQRVTYYHLAKLKKVGLAVKVDGVWLRAGAATLDGVAKTLGVAGIGATQKVRHWLDRKTRKDNREQLIAEKRERGAATMPKEVEVPAEPVRVEKQVTDWSKPSSKWPQELPGLGEVAGTSTTPASAARHPPTSCTASVRRPCVGRVRPLLSQSGPSLMRAAICRTCKLDLTAENWAPDRQRRQESAGTVGLRPGASPASPPTCPLRS